MLVCDRRFTASAGFSLYFCYRRHDVHLLRGPPGHLPGAAFFVAGGSPDSTPGDARGFRIFGPGLKLPTGAAPRRCPIKNLVDVSPSWPLRGGAANDATVVHTRAPKTLGAVGCLQCLLLRGV